MTEIRTVAVIPAFNESARVGGVIEAARAATVTDRVVVVDDGSKDFTFEVCEAAAQEPGTPLSVIRHDANRGKIEAAVTGVQAARELGGASLSTLIFLDANSLPIWSRDTSTNMKFWQKSLHQLLGIEKILLPDSIMQGRHQAFVDLLSTYIDEIADPVTSGRQAMCTGMYQRNTITDTLLPHISPRGGHAGNRAVSIDLWDRFEQILGARDGHVASWGLEAGLNALVEQDDIYSTFVMYGVVNVGSRVKAGGLVRGLGRMIQVHAQAPSTQRSFRA